MKKKAIIIGAGPAGLTAAYELLKRTDLIPVILEKSGDLGGISKTVNYKGNRIDIGGHRFFSKSDRVMNWWLNMMPVQAEENSSTTINYQQKTRDITLTAQQASDPDKVMLLRKRLSRIYFLRKFFTYPVQLSLDTLRKLGITTTIAIMWSYLKAQLLPRKPEKNLEDFMINRFGYKLYDLFFKDYTEKVWGVPCSNITAEWGAQRIKGVSISKAIQHAIQAAMKRKEKNSDIAQKDTETSLIEQFLYPKFGPGQLWEEVARQVQEMGGQILMQHDVNRIHTAKDGKSITGITALNKVNAELVLLDGDYFFSTMPVQELIAGLEGEVPENVQEVAAGLQYRDFITVGILLKKMSLKDPKTGGYKPLQLKDTWIYIQEREVKVGRLQLFNNWSPFMVKDPDTVWVGMEFFCNTTDDFWKRTDEDLQQLAIRELEEMGLVNTVDVLDATVLRMEKTYPAYFGTYERFDVIRNYIDQFENIFLVGRNGMHKYNNSDHSMLTAMVAVDNICAGITEKENIWSINTEQEYHEEKQQEKALVNPIRATVQNEWSLSLRGFIFKHPANRWFVWLGIAGVILQLVIFKFLYPYAGFINDDSYTYLETAFWNLGINTYPIGYSRFLRFFSVFSRSDTALVAFQYLFLQAGAMAFIFTLFYFLKPGKLVQWVLFGFMLLNPAFLYLSNYVCSDALFLALSLIWFTQLLWIIYKPTTVLIVWHAVILFLAFTVRYNALYYPLIAGLAFLLSKQYKWAKLAGFALLLALIGGFVVFTGNQYRQLTGKWQFSPFTGWQIANNAMYAYKFVDDSKVKHVPEKFRQLDGMIRTYFDTTRNNPKHPEENIKAGTSYMWDPTMPLRMYMEKRYRKDSTAKDMKKWATMGSYYRDYGNYLIRKYPAAFIEYYLIPNAIKYYAPPVEFLETYSTGVDSVDLIAQSWFRYKSKKIRTVFKDFNVGVLGFYPIMGGVVNILFIGSMLGVFFLQIYRGYPLLLHFLLVAGSLWLLNFGFSVFASPIALRFQLFPILVSLSFSLLLVEYLWKAMSMEEQSVQ